ncbi:MAG: sialate O-acetylesterase [Suipraeoptans sp.]
MPVAKVGCNGGVTCASACIDQQDLIDAPELTAYIVDYNEEVDKLSLEQYYTINKIVRERKEAPEAKSIMDYMMKHTITMEMVGNMSSTNGRSDEGNETDSQYMENYAAAGPNSENRPSGLYQMMLSQITGFTLKGVIWYQGEADVEKGSMYSKLFSKMIECWRRDWKDELPFLFVQLAPFGQWLYSQGDKFPIVRKQQEMVSKTINDTYMVSVSDAGDEFDIHPKNKRPVGYRLALCARNKVYRENLLSDAPEVSEFKKEGKVIILSFLHCEGLYITGNTLEAVKIYVDNSKVNDFEYKIDGEKLLLISEQFEQVRWFRIEFASTGYYKVNLYNIAGIPAKPFLFEGMA